MLILTETLRVIISHTDTDSQQSLLTLSVTLTISNLLTQTAVALTVSTLLMQTLILTVSKLFTQMVTLTVNCHCSH